MSKITPYLWYDNQAEQAAAFYCSLFKNSEITGVQRYTDAGPGPEGTAMIVNFTLDGREYIALNGGPQFKFNESFSLFVNCDSQDEIDELWAKLTADGGEPGQCGWLKDRWGLSWQIIPSILMELASGPDPERAGRVMRAMFRMQKIDIEALRNA